MKRPQAFFIVTKRSLYFFSHFNNCRNMETKDAAALLSALAYEVRLNIFRYLVSQGPNGASAGDIASACNIAPSTLSHHLNQMRNAGLVTRTREHRSQIYSSNFQTFDALLTYLVDDCCNGQPEKCLPNFQTGFKSCR